MKFKSIEDGNICELFVTEYDNLVSIRCNVIKILWKTKQINESKVLFLFNNQTLNVNIPLLRLTKNVQNCDIDCRIDNEINSDLLCVWDLKFVNSKDLNTVSLEVQRNFNLDQLKMLINEIYAIDILKISKSENVEPTNRSEVNVEEILRMVYILPLIERGDRLTVKFSNLVSVQKLKNQIAQAINYEETDFVLFHKFNYLEENKFVRDYQIINESTIIYCLYKKVQNLIKFGDIKLEGLCSKIYQVKDEETDQMIMIKKYNAKGILSDSSFKPMIRELVSFALLDANPRIVQLMAFYRNEKSFYMGMEYMSGGSLHTYVTNYKPVKNEVIIRWSKQMLEGIHYFHSNAVLHCNLKSSNVLLDDHNDIKISGFSLSKVYQGVNSDVLSDGFIMSKPFTSNFMAPEVFEEGEKLGSKADIWSFGAILVELVTGEEPFQGKNTTDIGEELLRNRTIRFNYPTSRPDSFKQFIDKCLAKDPDDRPSAAKLLKLLQELQ